MHAHTDTHTVKILRTHKYNKIAGCKIIMQNSVVFLHTNNDQAKNVN